MTKRAAASNAYPTLYGSPAARPDPALDASMVPGTRVRLSGTFLKNTGQRVGGEGQKTWTVLEGTPGSPDWVIVDELADTTWYAAAELEADTSLKWRRIARANLVPVGARSVRNCT